MTSTCQGKFGILRQASDLTGFVIFRPVVDDFGSSVLEARGGRLVVDASLLTCGGVRLIYGALINGVSC